MEAQVYCEAAHDSARLTRQETRPGMLRRRACGLVLLVVVGTCVGSAVAQGSASGPGHNPGRDLPENHHATPPEPPRDLMDSLLRGPIRVLGVEVGTDTFATVPALLGDTQEGTLREECHTMKELCYSAEGEDHTHLAFVSGPLDVQVRGVTSALLSDRGLRETRGGSDGRVSVPCKRIHSVSRALEIAPGLRLGITRGTVLALLGVPTVEGTEDLWRYWRSTRVRMREGDDRQQEEFDRSVSVEVRFVDDLVVAIEIGKLETL
jgi:hypothetical protein